jgi:hypothetical protein
MGSAIVALNGKVEFRMVTRIGDFSLFLALWAKQFHHEGHEVHEEKLFKILHGLSWSHLYCF